MPVKVGSKAQVFHGTAERTAGGLTQKDLMKTEKGRIVSVKQHKAGLNAIKRLRAAGFVAKKGEFKLFSKRASKKSATKKSVAKKSVAKKSVAKKSAAKKPAHKMMTRSKAAARKANATTRKTKA